MKFPTLSEVSKMKFPTLSEGSRMGLFLVSVCIVIIGLITFMTWGFSHQSDFADFKTTSTDRSRGVLTDFVVGLIAVGIGAVFMKFIPSLQVAHFSMILFMFQEMTNFLCDNALRNVHLRYHYEPEVVQISSIISTADTNSFCCGFKNKLLGVGTSNVTQLQCRARTSILRRNTKVVLFDASRLVIPVGTRVQLTPDVDEFIMWARNVYGGRECAPLKRLAGGSGVVEECPADEVACEEDSECGRRVFVKIRSVTAPITEKSMYIPVYLLRLDRDVLESLTQALPRFNVVLTNHGLTTRQFQIEPISAPASSTASSTAAPTVAPTVASTAAPTAAPNAAPIAAPTAALNATLTAAQLENQTLPTNAMIEGIYNTRSDILDTLQIGCLSTSDIEIDANQSRANNTMNYIGVRPSGLAWFLYTERGQPAGTEFTDSTLRDLIHSKHENGDYDDSFFYNRQQTPKVNFVAEDIAEIDFSSIKFDSFIKIGEQYWKPWIRESFYLRNIDSKHIFLYVPKSETGIAAINTFKYFMQADMVIKSASISLMTLFLLSTIETSVNLAICNENSRYLYIVGVLVANILGSTPINMVRFGWAYTNDARSGEGLRTSFVILLYLLLSAFWLTIQKKDDPFPLKAKVTMVVLGLALLVIFDSLSAMIGNASEDCPRTIDGVNADNNPNDSENDRRKKNVFRMIQFGCLCVMLALYISPIVIQFYCMKSSKKPVQGTVQKAVQETVQTLAAQTPKMPMLTTQKSSMCLAHGEKPNDPSKCCSGRFVKGTTLCDAVDGR